MKKSTIKRLEAWVQEQLANPAPRGGRNNQVVQVAPRMLELGWDEDGIVEAFMGAFGYDDDDAEMDGEIRLAVKSSARYVQPIDERSAKEIAEAKAKEAQARITAERLLKSVMINYRWTYDEITASSEASALPPKAQTQFFLQTLFDPSDIVWIGNVWSTGKPKNVANFQRVDHWLAATRWPGEFVSHCTFQNGVCSRSNDTLAERKYLVVESDELSKDEIGAVFNWLVAECEMNLRAVVFSGKRSLHGWFDWPSSASEAEIGHVKATLTGLKCDPSTLRASQPVRLPGVMRRETKTIQSLLYLA